MSSSNAITQMQQERTERARASLAKGEFKFSPAGNDWLVVNGDGKQYTVTFSTCTCQDFTDRGAAQGLRCKHIEALRILFLAPPTQREGENMETTQTTGWIKLYHPSGAQVSLPVPLLSRLTTEQAMDMLGSVSEYINAGFLVNAPGLEDGELLEVVNAVACREAKDGTPIIDFYSSNTKLLKKFMHVYLNTEQDVAAFEEAAGVKVTSLPVYDGALAIARDDHKAGKYIVNLPRPLKLIWNLSPKWEEWKAAGGEGNEPHKRMLVRYDTGAPAALSTSFAAARLYLDGTSVNGDLNERAAYDAFKKACSKNPASKTALRTWAQANKSLIETPAAANVSVN